MQILGVRWDCGDFVTIPGRCWSLPPDIPQDTTPLHGHTPDLGPERHAGEARVSRTDTPILHVTSLSCCFAPLISPQLPAGTPPPPPPAGFAFHRLTALSKHPAICPSPASCPSAPTAQLPGPGRQEGAAVPSIPESLSSPQQVTPQLQHGRPQCSHLEPVS